MKGSGNEQYRAVPAFLFLWKHTSNATLENFRRRAVVERPPLGVCVRLLADEREEFELVADIYQGWQ